MRKQVLVTMGGGEDGPERIETYLDALSLAPVEWDSHVVLGPLMADEQVRRFKRLIYTRGLSARVKLSRFHKNMSRLLQSSDAVVCMAGYNTCAEIMRSRVPAVLMPRTQPRKEQWIRARRLHELGLAHCLARLDADELRHQVKRVLHTGFPHARYPQLDGLPGVCRIIGQAMDAKRAGLQLTPKEQRKANAR
jgi:predicted glycosyltransferase